MDGMINRRQAITLSGSALALASEAAGTPANVNPFVVRSGEARGGGPWVIKGEKAFSTKVSGADIGKTYAAIEVHTPPGRGPGLHTHLRENEVLFILTGSIGLQCGSDRTILNAGDNFMVPANTPHGYVTLGTDPAHILAIFDPAGTLEGFFAEYASLLDVDGEPDPRKLVEVFTKHGMKMVGPALEVSSFASKNG